MVVVYGSRIHPAHIHIIHEVTTLMQQNPFEPTLTPEQVFTDFL
jgi:hypothetical protein